MPDGGSAFCGHVYPALNPDIAEGVAANRVVDALTHWTGHGREKEERGRRPSILHHTHFPFSRSQMSYIPGVMGQLSEPFDPNGCLHVDADLRMAVGKVLIDPARHRADHGQAERRSAPGVAVFRNRTATAEAVGCGPFGIPADPAIDCLSTDEDRIDEAGNRLDHFLKPDWSPEHLESVMCVLHLLVVRTSLFHAAGRFRPEHDRAQDYDLMLRCSRRSVLDHVGGFDDESFAVDHNDADLCLRIRKAGYRSAYTPYAMLYHFEQGSMCGERQDPVERKLFGERWADVIRDDPFHNPHLTRGTPDFALRKPFREFG